MAGSGHACSGVCILPRSCMLLPSLGADAGPLHALICPTPLTDVDDDAAYFSPDEDQVYTTPLRLLHAIDLYLARLRGSSTPAGQHVPALVSGGLGLSLAQLKVRSSCACALAMS